MSGTSLGLALPILVVGGHGVGATENACELARLAAARSAADLPLDQSIVRFAEP